MYKFMIKFKNQKAKIKSYYGQSLIEVVVALSIVSLLAIALITSSLVTQRTSRNATNDTQATKLVQQNIEQIRVFRDRRGFSALVDGACYVLNTSNPDPAGWTLNACGGVTANGEAITLSNTQFTRKVAITTSGANKKITVTVNWQDGSNAKTVSNVTILSNCVGVGNATC